MFKRMGVFGLFLAAAATTLLQPTQAFGQNRNDRGNNYANYDRNDRRQYGDNGNYYDRDDVRLNWRGRKGSSRSWRKHEWRERQRWEQNRYRNSYRSGYYNHPY